MQEILLLEDEIEMIGYVESVTGTNYEMKNGQITPDNLLVALNELAWCYMELKQDFDEYKEKSVLKQEEEWFYED